MSDGFSVAANQTLKTHLECLMCHGILRLGLPHFGHISAVMG